MQRKNIMPDIVIAALFPGQGSQALGMGRDFYNNSRAAKAILDRAEVTLPGLLELMWQGPEDQLQRTANQQPALVAAATAAFAAYREASGATPAYAAGHSLGEFSAYVAAGSLGLSQALRLVRKRGQYMQEAVPEGQGAMAAVLKTDREHVALVCQETEGVVEVANLNAPGQTVIAGEAAAVAAASARLKAEKARTIPLKVSAPFHCSLMAPAAKALAQDLAAISFTTPQFPVVANVSADIVADISQAPVLLTEQVTATVRWTESLQRLWDMGARVFIEFGSGSVLCALAKKTLDNPQVFAVQDMASLETTLQAINQLHTQA